MIDNTDYQRLDHFPIGDISLILLSPLETKNISYLILDPLHWILRWGNWCGSFYKAEPDLWSLDLDDT